MAQIIDMFTRQPIPQGGTPAATYASDQQSRAEFMAMARRGTDGLDADDEEWFVSTFKDYYLSEFMDCARGIEEASTVDDLDYFIRRAQTQVQSWPNLGRT